MTGYDWDRPFGKWAKIEVSVMLLGIAATIVLFVRSELILALIPGPGAVAFGLWHQTVRFKRLNGVKKD